jgi:hypothetical protein
VLEFTNPLAPNATANLVFGQGANGTNFGASTCSDGLSGNPAPSATGLCNLERVALDTANDLFVSDSANNRVLEYDTPHSARQSARTQRHRERGLRPGIVGH